MKNNKTDFEDDADKNSNQITKRAYTNLEEIPKLEWELAQKREQVIRPLVLVEKCTAKQARALLDKYPQHKELIIKLTKNR